MEGKPVEEMLTLFYKNLLNSCQKFVPRKGELKRKSIIPRERKILMRNRANINQQIDKARGTRKLALIKRLEIIEYKLLESHRKDEMNKEYRAIESIKDKPKYFFAYAKSICKTPIGPLERGENN